MNKAEQLLHLLRNPELMRQLAAKRAGRRELRHWAGELEKAQALHEKVARESAEALRMIREALGEVAA